MEKDSVVWEYTDNSTGDTSSPKEEALRETAAKKGQVCAFLWSDGDVPFGRQLWVYALVCLPVVLFLPFCCTGLGLERGRVSLPQFPRLTLGLIMWPTMVWSSW